LKRQPPLPDKSKIKNGEAGKINNKQIKKQMIMKIKNHVQLVGRLGANPEVKVLENGSKMAKFNLAVTETYVTKTGDKVSDVQWHSIVAWGALATIAERILQKGTQVTVDGKLFNRSYTSKDGIKRSSTEIVANELFVTQQKAA
jgi:single-strand DNA-binding protein